MLRAVDCDTVQLCLGLGRMWV